ncbi:ECF transporter S component (folate family) [Anaerobacterium chartisolvens]|uniref:ECF transporter S component (Folate family) n=1 Tax=Anaerobacterium chartisolvens TaxID=1297424 RepID=A0A369BF12_9FIRM|nr:folate family ECF transporter S component [Anaerobacterium chartisolvens]RCX20129.1 ECF transporter S component (folate family) [Anaerobacterium chartisolvens]
MNRLRIIISIGLLISIEVILTRFLSIQTPILRIGLGFIPIALSAMLFGPLAGALTGALADITGMMVFPQGAYFPGFTLSACLTGFVYGIFLHNNPRSLIKTVIAVFIIVAFIDLGLNTLWLSIITGKGALVLAAQRLVKGIVMLPVQVIFIQAVWRSIGSGLWRTHMPAAGKN